MPPLHNKIVCGLCQSNMIARDYLTKKHIYDDSFVKCKRLELKSQLPISHVFSHFALGILEIM
jgi:hypothetical protein